MNIFDNYEVKGQMSIFDMLSLDTWSGKTSPEPLAQTKERTSDVSSKKRQKSKIKMPLYLDLRRGGGLQVVVSWEMGGALLGEYTMHSFGVCPSEGNESRLSQILEENPHPKYSLSARACQGILRRAENRGKVLPKILEQALRNQAKCRYSGGKSYVVQSGGSVDIPTFCVHLTQDPVTSIDKSYSVSCGSPNGQCTSAILMDAHKHQEYRQSKVVGPLTTDQNQHVRGDTPIIINSSVVQSCAYDGSQTSPTPTANNADGSQRMPDKDNFNAVITYGLDRASFNQGQNALYDFSIEEEKAQTIVSKGPGAVMTKGGLGCNQ